MNERAFSSPLSQLIFSRRCTEAEGWRWHENHFCCQDCAGPLGGGRYALPGGGPCCPSCFESRYSDAGTSPAATLEGRLSLGKGGKVQIKGEEGLGWAEEGFLPGWDPGPSPTPSRPSSSALQQRPRPPTAPPKPEPGGPQISPCIPGRSAPRASRTHPAPRLRLRRGTSSWTGNAAALWWAEAGRGEEPRRGLPAAAARNTRGRAGRLGISTGGPRAGIWEWETRGPETGLSDSARSRGGGARRS